MNNWIIGTGAILLWFAATILYLRKNIVDWFKTRRLQRKMLAEARAKYQAELAARKDAAPGPPRA